MECNKDEAVRAKGIAEEKMQKNDFEGARKIALKARNLFPELDNISQLISVCDVHCSAQKKIHGADKDLYGILQVEKVADEATIRKQYRKLALVLHPDKNKFPGAEAAFKLIGEANMTLSDKGKRTIYDIKCREPARASVTKLQHQGNQSSYGSTQFTSKEKSSNNPSSQFNGNNNRQKAASNSSIGLSFWTFCPFCNIKYEYYREYVNRPLRCQNCSKLFIAYEVGSQEAAPGSGFVHGQKATQPNVSQQEPRKQEKVKVNIQFNGNFPSHFAHQTSSTGVQFAQHTKMEDPKVGSSRSNKESGKEQVKNPKVNGPKMEDPKVGSSKTSKESGKEQVKNPKVNVPKMEDPKVGSSKNNKESGKEQVKNPKINVPKPMETGNSNDTNRKRGRNVEAECSEGRSDVKDACGGSGVSCRRSSRHRQEVSYREDAGGGDALSPQKRARLSKSSSDVEDMKKEEVSIKVDKDLCKQKTSEHADESMPDGNKTEDQNVEREEAVTPDDRSNSDFDLSDSKPMLVDCLEPEFYNFDKDKEKRCFAVDQIWACYDDVDGMPRFYARVRKIYSSEFKMRITWLEAEPENELEIKWANEDLPVSCGRFVHGGTEMTRDHLMFSHQMPFEKCGSRSSYVIRPQKGETWALFKNWDIKWSLDPDNHRNYKFDIVEILSVQDDGISVGFLLKVKGFVSLFQRSSCAEKITSNELFRFSHFIPSVKLFGTERAGVPAGSFELDPAALAGDLEEYYHSKEGNLEPEKVSSCEEKVKMSPKKHANSEAKNGLDNDMLKLRRTPRGLKNQKPMKEVGSCQSSGIKKDPETHDSVGEEKVKMTHKKHANSEAKNGLDDEMLKLRRTPRGLKNQKPMKEVGSYQSSGIKKDPETHDSVGDEKVKMTPKKHANSEAKNGLDNEMLKLRRTPRGLKNQKPMEEAGSVQCNRLRRKEATPSKGQDSVGGDGVINTISKNLTKSPRISSPCGKLEQVIHDFSADKNTWKFQVSQILAFWGIRLHYAQIKKIKSHPFRLHVSLLSPCNTPSSSSVFHKACGLFTVSTGGMDISPYSVSHIVKTEVGKNIYRIYPKEQQIWALHKGQDADNMEGGECEIVQVRETNESSIKVLSLVRVPGYKSVFKAPRIQRSTARIVVIPRVDLINRFFRQIPAFLLTGEKYGFLNGCWELDPAALAGVHLVGLDRR